MELWVDKYASKSMDEYVWRDTVMRERFEEWIQEGALPHLLFSGKPGMGKTSLARLLLKLLNVPEGDILFIKASSRDARTADGLETKITRFAQTYPMFDNQHGIKYIILDEADSMSPLAQRFLRSEIEQYSATVRFIFTCNYPDKMESAVVSRCQQFHFDALSQQDFVLRILAILQSVLADHIDETYPDLRKCIGVIQKNTVGGVLRPKTSETFRNQSLGEVVNLFQQRKHTEARKMLISSLTHEEYPDAFRFLYENMSLFADTEEQEDDGLVIVRDGLFKHNFISDPEINISATIVQLVRMRS